jgi:hypothetical protein
MEASLKRRYGEKSSNVQKFKQACGDAYDSCLSYRFLYKLRNYAQHCGMPISEVYLETRRSAEDAGQPYSTLTVGIRRDAILRDYKWGSLRDDIANLPEFIEINAHIEQLMSRIQTINLIVAQDEFAALFPHAVFIKTLIDKIPQDEDGIPCVFGVTFNNEGSQGEMVGISEMQPDAIPVDLIKAIVEGNFADLRRSYTVRGPIMAQTHT